MNDPTRRGIDIHEHLYNIETAVQRFRRLGYGERSLQMALLMALRIGELPTDEATPASHEIADLVTRATR